MDQFSRHIANRVWISDLYNGKFVEKESELDSSYVLLDNKKISRAYIIATVIQKFENEDMSYASITIDDGSSDIRIKAWKNDIDLISNSMIGDLILVVAKVKKYNDEIYLVPEIIKKIDPNWELVHKISLLKRPKQEVKEESYVLKTEEIRFNDNL